MAKRNRSYSSYLAIIELPEEEYTRLNLAEVEKTLQNLDMIGRFRKEDDHWVLEMSIKPKHFFNRIIRVIVGNSNFLFVQAKELAQYLLRYGIEIEFRWE